MAYAGSVDSIRLGTVWLSSEDIAGTLYLDDFVSHQSEYIGLNGEEEQGSSRPSGEGGGTEATPIPVRTPTFTPTATFTSLPTRTATPTPMRTATPTSRLPGVNPRS